MCIFLLCDSICLVISQLYSMRLRYTSMLALNVARTYKSGCFCFVIALFGLSSLSLSGIGYRGS